MRPQVFGSVGAPRRMALARSAGLVVLLAAAAAGCHEGNAGGACACSTSSPCGGGYHCDGCYCRPDCGGDDGCPADAPNCGADGQCFGPCTGAADCVNPVQPNCDPATGLCQGPCPDPACPEAVPNCDASGLCFGPCAEAAECVNPAQPNCDPVTGVCQGPCPAVPCPETWPDCDPATGRCGPPCAGPDDCPPERPNCLADGRCAAPCAAHADCAHPDFPNCQLDPALADAGHCGPPCVTAADCASPLYPNCDPTPGQCLPPCADDGDCPAEAWKCDPVAGICFLPACTDDAGCDPPVTVCESWACVAGCTTHADCAAADRCDLVTPTHLNHCEPRDCLGDSDCTLAGQVCDTDGLATPDGGGYCVPGCQSHYDCGQAGYDCDPGTGRCTAHDYGDIGLDCGGGCHSGLCLAGQGNLCTGFCCVQHDCPAGWGCRPYDDGTGSGHTVDVCQPLTPAQGDGEYDDPCTDHPDCRSGICTLNRCAETCCTHADCTAPFATDRICLHDGDSTICSATPATGTDPLGTTGCSTTGTPVDCLSNLCYYYFFGDFDCPTNACPADYQCFDLGYGLAPLECVRDFCVDHCCTAADCPDDAEGNAYTCSKVLFGVGGDYNVCLLDRTPGALGEGEACTQDSQCRSRFCSQPSGVCRARCCRDGDCADPGYPRCALEASRNQTRYMNVCVP